MRQPELLIPAGSLPVLKVAVHYGADAIYIGGEAFGLREKAVNFTFDQMKEGIEYAHKAGAKVYVTANIFAHNADLEEAKSFLSEVASLRPDGILISDPGMFMTAKSVCPTYRSISVPRQIPRTTPPASSGVIWVRRGWCSQGSLRLMR